MKAGYEIENGRLGTCSKFIAVYNYEFLNKVVNQPCVNTYYLINHAFIGQWKIKQLKTKQP